MLYSLRKLHGKVHDKKTKLIESIKIRYDIRRSTIHIMTIDETLDCLVEGKSIARFGDGEFDLIFNRSIRYQSADTALARSLRDILTSKPNDCIIAIPDAISTLDNLTQASLHFWIDNMARHRNDWVDLLTRTSNQYYKYGNAHVSRCYIRYENKKNSTRWFDRLMNLWNGRDIVIVEGEKTHLGCGNDFLKNAKTVRRIIGPAENAFEKKDEILNFIKNEVDKKTIVVLALGPTATVLAYELSHFGYQALDLGHCDIEYEWYLMGASEKVAIQGKYTNEVSGGRIVEDTAIDDRYECEIIKKFV